MPQPLSHSPAALTDAQSETRWPIGWCLLGAFAVSGLLWWGIASAGAAALGLTL